MESVKLFDLLLKYIKSDRSQNNSDTDFLVKDENSDNIFDENFDADSNPIQNTTNTPALDAFELSEEEQEMQKAVMAAIENSDTNNDGIIDENEQTEVLDYLQSNLDVDFTGFSFYSNDTAVLDEEINTDTEVENIEEMENALNVLLENDENIDEEIKENLNNVNLELDENIKRINELLENKENLTPEEQNELEELMNKREELIAKRDELEEIIKENASEDTINSLEEMQEARNELKAESLEDEESLEELKEELLEEEIIEEEIDEDIEEVDDSDEDEDLEEDEPKEKDTATNQASSAGSGSVGSPSYNSGAPSGNNYNYNSNGNSDANGSSDGTGGTESNQAMTLEELKSTRTTQQAEVTTAQNALTEAQGNLDSANTTAQETEVELSSLQEDMNIAQTEIDSANQAMQDAINNSEEVSQENKDALTTKEGEIKENNDAIFETDNNIETTEKEIAQKETGIVELETSIASHETNINTYRGNISSLESTLSGIENGETEESKKAAIAERQRIKGEISELEGKLNTEIEAKEKLEKDKTDLITQKEEFETTLEKLLADRPALIETQERLESEKNELLETIKNEALNDTNVQEAIKAYEDKKAEHQGIKDEYENAKNLSLEAKSEILKATKEVDSARKDLDTKKANLEETEKLITQKEIENAKNTPDEGSAINFDENLTFNLTDSQKADLENFKQIYAKNKDKYEKVAQKVFAQKGIKIAPEVIAAIHKMESDCNFGTYLHNGEKLGKVTTLVPKGVYFENWEEAAVDAICREMDSTWTSAQKKYGYGSNLTTSYRDMLLFTERYNGFGTRNKGKASSYVYTGTTKYTGGRYVSDGNYDPNSYSKRIGTAVMIAGLFGKL